ncbi:beta strand repeat-containing protein [Rosistilla ulvae]|uniref:beta strand repeat-containing protein n=1 Tax=Rosistilla ulvae TaxID=1930277 RepID=UPI001C54C387|nr:hypothetical protein [Rosistilla ulvae]
MGRLEKRIVLDASGVLSAMGELVITSDAAAANETVTIDTNTDGELQITELGSPLEIVDELGAPVASLAGVTSIDVSLGEGQDLLVVDFSAAPLPSSIPNISYHGGAASDPSGAPLDRLSVIGSGTQSAIYALDTLLPADGSLQVGDPSLASTTIAFDGLQPIEITGMASTLLQTNDASGGSSTIEISGEFDLVGGGSDADLNVHDGAVLSGTGTVQAGDLTANVNLQSGSTLSPGNSPGIMAVADLNFADNTTFDVEIDDHDSADPLITPTGGVAGIDYDQMQVQGSVTIGTGVVLDLEDLGSTEANPRDVYTIIDNDGSDAIVGRFVDTSNVVLENGDTVTAAGGLRYRIDYNGGDGNDVVLTGIPASRSEVFVSNSFTQTPGTLIADVDFNTDGNQPGLYGIDAFGTLAEAIANVDSGGTVYVDAGTFAHSGTLLIDRSVTIEGQGMNQTEIRKAVAPVGIDDEAIRLTADNVTLRGMQLGWVDFLSNDGQGNVVVTHADQTTIDRVQFGETLGGDPSNDEGYRSAIVFENADDLVVSDSNFAGRWASAAIRDGSGGSGERLLITGNQFSEDHLHGEGPISIGSSPGAPGATVSGTIAFNYFANGIDPTDTPSAGDQYITVAIADRVVGTDGLTIHNNTFHWHDASLPAESVGVSIDPAIPGADRISIQDNIFDGFASGDAAAVQSSGVITPVNAVVTNNVFFGNDIDSNQPLDASNRTGADADPFFDGEQVGFAGSTLPDFFALRYGSAAAYQSISFQADIATATPHIGANQGDPTPVGTEDIVIAGTDLNDLLVVTFDGGGSGTFVLTTGVGTASETTLGPVVFSDITSLTFDSYGGDDVMKIVQPDGGSIDVGGGIFFNAGSQTLDGDALILESGLAQTTIDSVHYFFADEGIAGHVGSIAITDASHNGGLGGTTTIHYDGLEPIYDSLNVDDRSFTFNSTAAIETITLSSPGDSADPMLPPLDNKIGSEFGGVPLSEVVHFNNPNVSLTINGGDGDQTINIDSLDADYHAALSINGDDGVADVVNFNSSLGALLLGSGSVTGTLTVTAETIAIHDGVSIDTSGGDTDGDVTFDAIAGITMHDTSTLAAGTADVRMSAQGDIGISRIVSAETVAITTTDGRIVDNRSSDESANITATSAALRSATGIGSGTAADDADLDLDVSNLAAVTNAGDIHLQNAKELSVTTVDGLSGIAIIDPLNNNALGIITIRTAGAFQVAVGNGILNSDGGDITLAAEGNTVDSDLSIAAAVTASGGSGNIHLLAGDSIAVAAVAVTATQAGAILLSSGTDFNNGSPRIGSAAGQIALTSAARVQSDAGHISLLSADSIGLGSDVQVQTSGSGTIDLYSTGGAIAMDTTAILQSTDGDIRVSAHDDFTIGDIVASAATVSLTSATGSILDADANDSDLDVVAQRLRFDAAVGFGELGASSNAIETSVDVVSGRSASGGIHLVESDGVTVGDVDATVYRVSATTVPTAIVDGSQSDLVTIGGNGSVVLRSLAGDITLTDGTATADGNAVVAHGSGNVLIAAEGIDADTVVDADIRSTSGNLSLIAAGDLKLNADVDVQTGTDGTIDVEASAGLLTMDATATLQSVAGDIRGVANNDLTIGDIFATNANVSLTARTGSILDADGDDIDVTAQGLRLNAAEGIGTLGASSNAIETSIGVVTARAAVGGINLLESDAVTVGDVAITVNRVASDASVVVVEDAAQSDLGTTADNGSIVLRSLAGDVTLTDGHAATDGNAVVADGSGNVLIAAEGIDADIVVDADIRSTSGNLSLIAAGDLKLNADVDVQTGTDGTIDVEASTGSLAMDATATLQSVAGDIRGVANNDLTIGDIVATDANVSLTARTGSILDADPDDADIDVTAQGLRLNAAEGIGTLGASSNAIETSVDVVTARAAAGGINLLESNGITVGDVAITVNRVTSDASVVEVIDGAQSDLVTTSDNGSIVLRSLAGDVTLTDGTAAADGNAVVAHGSGNVLLQTIATTADIIIDGDVRSQSGHVSINAADDIHQNADLMTGGEGTISLTASNSNDDGVGNDGIVMRSDAQTVSGGGNIRLQAAGESDLFLGLIDAGTGDVSLLAERDVLDNNGATLVNVRGDALRIVADANGNQTGTIGTSDTGNSIESNDHAIQTAVTTLAAVAGDGIYILESDAIAIDHTTDISVQQVGADATVTTITDTSLSDLETTDAGPIKLKTLAGTITINEGDVDDNGVRAAGLGDVLIAAGGNASDVVINAGVSSDLGNVSISAGDDIALAADLSAGGEGTVWIQAGNAFAETPAVDGFHMLAGSTITSGGDIAIESLGESDLVVQAIDAGTDAVRLSAAGNIVDGNGAALNITAGAVMLIADANSDGEGSIGSPDPSSLPSDNLKAIDIAAQRVAARSADGIYLHQTAGDLIVDAVTVDVNRVHFNSTTSEDSQTLADLETTDSGSIKVVASDGDLTLDDGDDDGGAVSAAGGGDVLLDARGSGNLNINGSVFSGSGQIGLQAQESIELANDVTVQTGGDGTIVIDASLSAGTSGAIAMAAEARVQTENGDIHIAADQTISVGRIETLANVSITSIAGSIVDTDMDDAAIDVTAAGLRMNAFDGVGVLGATANGLETQVATLSARAGSGGVHVIEADGLRIDDVAVQVQRPEFRSTLTTVNDLAQSDLRTTDDGSIVLRSLAGEITLNEGTASAGDGAIQADGIGNVLIAAEGLGSQINANANIVSGVGNISLIAADSIAVAAGVNVTTAANGTIDLEATTGALTMAATATLQTDAGDIRAAAGADLTIGDIVATDADVSLISTGGSILDADPDDANVDVTAIRLRLAAAIGVGTATNAIETDVDTLSGRATSGGNQLLETDNIAIDDVEVTVQRIANDATSTNLTDALQSDLRTTGGSGSIALQTLDGSITLNEGTAATGDGAISANGSGNVQINASGVDSDLIAGADVASGSGAIVLDASRNILLNAGVDVTTAGAGTIALTATTGNLTMAPTATLQSVAGNITGTAAQDVTIGDITSTMANVILTSQSSQIIDADPAGDSDQDIAAVEAILTAPLGIGVGNAIETSVDVLEAEATTSGTIAIVESDAIELRRVITGDGRIAVTAGGTITATEVQSTNASSSDAAIGQADSRDIALVANGAASSILVTKITAAAGADVHLTADNDILDTDIDDDNLIFADDLHLIAGNQSDDGDNAVQLTTTINDLQAEVSGSGRGDLEILETDALNLVTSDEATDADVLRTSNGEIRVSAGGSIVLADPDLSNDGGDRTADPEIVAGGDNGRILLQTDGDLTIDEGVQIHAAQSTVGAVRISAVGEIVLGDQIEINTGASTGVARVFAPRPEEGVTDTAFYDYDTVSTTILASEPGGFGGDLTIDVGTTGERGLAIEIDWGAESGRFEVVDGIDGDSMTTVHHMYTEAEVLTSTLNGRVSSTSPIEVRFAVRQHESIVMEGASIQQGLSGTQIVDGGLISSTDNPITTPLLENGETSFMVPNLSIPTRLFFPPPEYPELVRRVSESYIETSTLLTTTTHSTETTTVTTTTARDEYFQIRVISPDPNVESEVPPERLPDDILSGDKLQTLFANLPDGTYEVEYVLGEGNARSILRVEIRQGKPIIPGEDLEGGLLKLKELDLDSLKSTPSEPAATPSDLETTQVTPTAVESDFSAGELAGASVISAEPTPLDDRQTPHAWQPEPPTSRDDGLADATTERPNELIATAAGTSLIGWMAKKRNRHTGGEFSLTRRIARRFAK